ncbi:MAG: N-acetylmuramoyl-L-alanine amidase, partial [Acidimicrobiales bacterium]
MLARTVACAVIMSVGISVVGTPQRDRPKVQGEDHLLASGSVGVGFGERTDVEAGVEMAGVTWDGDADAVIAVRGLTPDGTWSAWSELVGEADEGPDRASPEHRARRGAGPAWLGHDMREVETRVVSGRVSGLEMHAIDTEAVTESPSPFGLATTNAAPSSPLLVTRAQWGADESWRNLGNPGCDGQPRYASNVQFSVVHHTADSNDYSAADVPALLRGIYYFHTHDRGWCDVAYNFFIDRFGRGFEGRAGGIDQAVIGGHTGGFNTGSTGVAVIGNFDTASVPDAAYSALRSL